MGKGLNMSCDIRCLPVTCMKETDVIVRDGDNADITESVSSRVVLPLCGKGQFMGTIGISAHRLLCHALAKYAVSAGGQKPGAKALSVYIPLSEYAALCGYEYGGHETIISEDGGVDLEPMETDMDLIRAAAERDLKALFQASVLFRERAEEGGAMDFFEMHVLNAEGIEDGTMILQFSRSMVELLEWLPAVRYPAALFSTDVRNADEYSVGLKLAQHKAVMAARDRRNVRPVHVKGILKCTSLPVCPDDPEWRSAMRKPFEYIMDSLVFHGVLGNWSYRKNKTGAYASCGEWLKAAVCFELTGFDN